jgi:hypothetical protein
MELMDVYHEARAKWIIARATSGKCEGSEFVFDLIESGIRKEATEILLTPVQESDMGGFRSTALLLSAAQNYPGSVCVLSHLSCPHW